MTSTEKNFFQKFFDAWKYINGMRKVALSTTNCDFIPHNTIEEYRNSKDGFSVFGTSICGDDTSLLIEDGKIGLGAGPGVARLPLPQNLFISHDHDDHIIGLPSLACRSASEERDLDVYIGKNIPKRTLKWIEKIQKNPDSRLKFHFVQNGERKEIDNKTKFEFFKTNHSKGSLGLSILKRKEEETWENYLTYTGDINLNDKEMRADRHLHNAKNLIIEASYYGNKLTEPIYDSWSHSSFDDIDLLLNERKVPPDSVTYMHLPYAKLFMTPCKSVELTIKSDRTKDVGYIPTCLDGLKNPLKPRSRVVVSTKKL